MVSHKVFAGGTTSFQVREDDLHVESKSGNMYMDINGLDEEIFQGGGFVKMGLKAAGQVLLMSDDGSLVIMIDVAYNQIRLVLGDLKIVFDGNLGILNFLLGDIGIRLIPPGVIGFILDGGACFSLKMIIELLKAVLSILGILKLGDFGIGILDCDDAWEWVMPEDYEPPWG